MNIAPILVVVRYIISAIGVVLITRGYFTQEEFSQLTEAAMQIIGCVLAIAPMIYGAWQKRATAQIAHAAALPQVVQPIVTDAKTAAKIDRPNVVAG